MSVCYYTGRAPRLQLLLQFQFPATEPNGSMVGAYTASEVAFRATAEAFCFARDRGET